MDGGKEYPHPHHTAPEQRGRERKRAYRNRTQQQGGNRAASGEGQQEPRHKHGQNRTHQGCGLRAVRIPYQRGGVARTAGRLPVRGEGAGQREEEIRPLHGCHRTAAPHRTRSRIHTQRRIRLQGTCGSIAGNLRLCQGHAWREQGDSPHHPIEEQTDDSAGERQEIHLQPRFPLLAVSHGNHFTLIPYHIYTEVK